MQVIGWVRPVAGGATSTVRAHALDGADGLATHVQDPPSVPRTASAASVVSQLVYVPVLRWSLAPPSVHSRIQDLARQGCTGVLLGPVSGEPQGWEPAAVDLGVPIQQLGASASASGPDLQIQGLPVLHVLDQHHQVAEASVAIAKGVRMLLCNRVGPVRRVRDMLAHMEPDTTPSVAAR